jgi:hypothetical protein
MNHGNSKAANYGTEGKVFVDKPNLSAYQQTRKNGVPQIAKATRKAVFGSPNLRTLTTAHIERRFVRKHTSLDGMTPAQAAGVAVERWTLEDVVDLTARFMRKREDAKLERAFAAI